MAQLSRTPGTCSLMNMTGVIIGDNLENDIQGALARDKALGFAARMSGIFCVVTRRDIVEKLKRVGFQEKAKYDSHNHRTKCSLMFRKVSAKEFNSGQMNFPKKKGNK